MDTRTRQVCGVISGMAANEAKPLGQRFSLKVRQVKPESSPAKAPWKLGNYIIYTRYAQESLTQSASMAEKHRHGEEVSEEISEVVHPSPNALVEDAISYGKKVTS